MQFFLRGAVTTCWSYIKVKLLFRYAEFSMVWPETTNLGPYVWGGANSLLNRVYLLNGYNTEKIGMRGAEIGLFERPKRVLSYGLTYQWYRLFKEKKLTHALRHIITHTAKRSQENIEWEGVIGSLTSATIEPNFELETDTAVVMRSPIRLQFSTPRNLHCR